MEHDGLTKVHVDLPNHWAVGGESIWARSVGVHAFELHTVPFHAYDLNYLDVVEAVSQGPERKPSVRRVLRRSGHRTLRLFLKETTPNSDRAPLLESLKVFGASFERANRRYFAIDIAPTGDYEGTCARLDEWSDQGILDYETCEARVPGSFDDQPRKIVDGAG